MNSPSRKLLIVALISILADLPVQYRVRAQFVPLQPVIPLQPSQPWQSLPNSPTAQRNALDAVRAQVHWLRNATQTAPSYVTGSYGMVFQQFHNVRLAYNDFKRTLTPDQLTARADDFAELEAGLQILQQAFADYHQRNGAVSRSTIAFENMCQVLNEGAGVWLQEFEKMANRQFP